jgi:hypothetical protein
MPYVVVVTAKLLMVTYSFWSQPHDLLLEEITGKRADLGKNPCIRITSELTIIPVFLWCVFGHKQGRMDRRTEGSVDDTAEDCNNVRARQSWIYYPYVEGRLFENW